jgi:hypothetical protein
MVKITETTELSETTRSFQIDIGKLDAQETLEQRYQHYLALLERDKKDHAPESIG